MENNLPHTFDNFVKKYLARVCDELNSLDPNAVDTDAYTIERNLSLYPICKNTNGLLELDKNRIYDYLMKEREKYILGLK